MYSPAKVHAVVSFFESGREFLHTCSINPYEHLTYYGYGGGCVCLWPNFSLPFETFWKVRPPFRQDIFGTKTKQVKLREGHKEHVGTLSGSVSVNPSILLLSLRPPL